MAKEKVIGIEELVQDQHNFNKGTEQGGQLMEQSFKELGAGRSILVDKNGNIIAGNKSQKAAMAAGIKRVRVIYTTGDELIAMKRTDVDIDSAEGRRMAYLDNLTTQINLEWDKTELDAVQAEVEGFDIVDFGFDIEDLPQVTFPTGERKGDEGEDGGMLIQGEGDAASTACHFIKFGRIQIPLSDEDNERFTQICDEYFKKYGVFVGLGHEIIEKYDKNS